MYQGFGFQEMSQAITWAEYLHSVQTESEIWLKSKNYPQPQCGFSSKNPFLMGEEKEEKKGTWIEETGGGEGGRNGQLVNQCLSELNFTPNFVLKYKTFPFF